MITTVTLNPCIDLTMYLPALAVGGLNLADSTRTDASGKGINVALVLRELGLDATCAGISFAGNGSLLEERLRAAGIPFDFAMAPGNIRTNIKAVDLSKSEMTELNSRGDPVGDGVIEDYMRRLDRLAAASDIVTFSGRIPNGGGEDIYRRSLERIAGSGARTVLDAERAPLALALQARPTVIKPNAYELETLTGKSFSSYGEMVRTCREIIAGGVEVVCVSLGGDGALIADARSAFRAPALPLTPRGFQGSGDSVVAGLCKAMAEGLGIRDMLRFGMAAAAASIIREGTLLCRREDYDRFLPQVATEEIAA